MPGVSLNSDGKDSAEREGRYGTLIGYLIKKWEGFRSRTRTENQSRLRSRREKSIPNVIKLMSVVKSEEVPSIIYLLFAT